MGARFHFGCMGWQEKDWIGSFYPEGTKVPDMLALYARKLPTVEVDSTFYGRPRETTVTAWRDAVPDDFRFALKVPREVTHKRHFEEVDEYFGWFIERVRALGDKLGAVLLQCGRDFAATPANRERLYAFLDAQLPPDIKVVLELRDARWYDDAFFEMARSQRFAFAAAEGPHSSLELAERILAEQRGELDFAYVRLMGLTALEHYDRVQLDKSSSLDVWHRLLTDVASRVSDVFVYVSDDYAGHAPGTIDDLRRRLDPGVATSVSITS
jgi:uncharacterized protein YecE (DUF72 family)